MSSLGISPVLRLETPSRRQSNICITFVQIFYWEGWQIRVASFIHVYSGRRKWTCSHCRRLTDEHSSFISICFHNEKNACQNVVLWTSRPGFYPDGWASSISSWGHDHNGLCFAKLHWSAQIKRRSCKREALPNTSDSLNVILPGCNYIMCGELD